MFSLFLITVHLKSRIPKKPRFWTVSYMVKWQLASSAPIKSLRIRYEMKVIELWVTKLYMVQDLDGTGFRITVFILQNKLNV